MVTVNDTPIRLKPEDSAAPPDAQSTGIELMALLASLETEAEHLRDLYTAWGDDPIAVSRRAQARAIEIHDAAARARMAGESLMRSFRYAGLFRQPTRGV